MSTDPYEDILGRVQKELTQEQQNKLVDELSQLVARKNGNQSHSILDLEGLGKEIWKDIDPDEYVKKERDSWDG